MGCINRQDGELAYERAANQIYPAPWFVPLCGRFVMIVVSTLEHAQDGVCPRFGKVTCKQHLDCWTDLKADHGDRFVIPGSRGEMISPQHAWFAPDGTLLQRKEYELTKNELLKRMRSALASVRGEPKPDKNAERRARAYAPLDDRDRAELASLKTGDKLSRWAALGKLLATEKVDVHAALIDLLKSTKDAALKCDILRAFGQARVLDAQAAAEDRLGDEEAEVRSFAAVCLEDLGARDSVRALLKRARTERVAVVRKNLYRALGACGGPEADKAAAKALFKAIAKDSQKIVRKHAALALRGYAGAGAKLVLRRLEQAALRTKDRDVRGAIVYALAYVGNQKTTVRVMEKVLDETREGWARSFVESALKRLKGEKVRFSGSWLFWEDRDDLARKDETGPGR